VGGFCFFTLSIYLGGYAMATPPQQMGKQSRASKVYW
jgi:hypothetical protein